MQFKANIPIIIQIHYQKSNSESSFRGKTFSTYPRVQSSTGLKGTGNSLNNTIKDNNPTRDSSYGGSFYDIPPESNDTLDGGGGIDTLYGGTGDHTYIVDNAKDTIIEDLNYTVVYDEYLIEVSKFIEDIDTVASSVSYTLGDNLENLTLTGSKSIDARGNSLDNTLTGNAAKNTLSGSTGNDFLIADQNYDSDAQDTLIGGAGADKFGFYSPYFGTHIIEDFVVAEDTIYVGSANVYGYGGYPLYKELGDELTRNAVITPDQFIIGSAAADTSDRFIYDSDSGKLSIDPDGTGAVGQFQFAMLSPGLATTNEGIFIVKDLFLA